MVLRFYFCNSSVIKLVHNDTYVASTTILNQIININKKITPIEIFEALRLLKCVTASLDRPQI